VSGSYCFRKNPRKVIVASILEFTLSTLRIISDSVSTYMLTKGWGSNQIRYLRVHTLNVECFDFFVVFKPP
jgi:hypothetical protein